MTNLPNILLSYYVIQIRNFDFDVKYINNNKNITADVFSYQPTIEKDYHKKELEDNLEDFINNQIYINILIDNKIPILSPELYWITESLQIAKFLI